MPSTPPSINHSLITRFDPVTNIPVSWRPSFVISADVNSDGKQDLIVTSQEYQNSVSVLLGNGDGSFATAKIFFVGDNPFSVTSADVNSDGKLDLITANYYSSDLSILLGNGDGSFATTTNVALGEAATSVTSADINSDGKLDLVASNWSSNGISLLLGNGDGSFAAATNFATGSGSRSITCADVNNDGKLDLISANGYANDISVLLGNGDGNFGSAVNFVIGSYVQFITSADLNGDGNLDLVTASNTVSVLLGNGDGSFAPAFNIAVGASPYAVSVVDVNGDGKLDLIAANVLSNNVSVLLGHGDGSFATATNLSVGDAPVSVASADFNDDGRLDLVTANGTSMDVSVLLNDTPAFSTTTFTEQTPVTLAPTWVINDAEGNWNGGSLSVQITANFNAADIITLATNNPGGNGIWLDTTKGNLLMAGATQIGTADAAFVSNGIAWHLTFNANANNGLVQATAAALQFNNISDTPSLGNRTVMFTVTDSEGLSASDTQTITITPVNDAPTTSVVTLVSLIEDGGSYLITQTQLLANANDVDTPSLTATHLAIASGKGNLVDNSDGTWTYTPELNDDTSVSFSYTVTDGGLTATGSATMDITPVNDAPIISGISISTDFIEQTPVTLAPTLVINDAEGNWNGGSLSVQITANFNAADIITLATNNPGGNGIWLDTTKGNLLMAGATQIGTADAAFVSNGVAWHLTFNANANNGLVQATAAALQFNNTSDTPSLGNRSVMLTVTDSDGLSASDTQTITITPVNDAPTTSVVTLASILEDSGSYLITQTQLLANANDVDNPSLTATHLAIASGKGNLVNNSDGTWTYTPALNDDTTVSFSYTVTDGSLTAPGSATLDITPVNDAPMINGVPITTAGVYVGVAATLADFTVTDPDGANVNLNVTLTTFNGSINDLTDADSNTAGIQLTGTAGSINAALAAATFTASTDGAASIDISVSDGAATPATAIYKLMGQLSTAPALTGTAATLAAGTEDVAYTVTKSELLAGWTNVGNTPLNVTNLTADHGSVVDNGNGSYTITPMANFNGGMSLFYGVTDGTANVAATLDYTITPVNDLPTGTAIISGIPTPNHTLSASNTLTDADGRLEPIRYQWQANGSNISGANGSIYTLTYTDIGKTITVAASYTDGYGTIESVTSFSTTVVEMPALLLDTTNGNDIILGSNGVEDAVGYVSATKSVKVDLSKGTANGGGGIDKLNSIEDVAGSVFNDSLTGNGSNNTLDGLTGNDTLTGNGGNDILMGGEGNDKLFGGTDNDILDGGYGKDTLSGGDGNDTYYINDYDANGIKAADAIKESSSEKSGIDTVHSSIDYTLANNVEILLLDGASDINGTGNKSANTIIGNSSNNTLNGREGYDTLTGGDGSDIFKFDTGIAAKKVDGITLYTNVDTITDFASGTDSIALSAKIFTAYKAEFASASKTGAEVDFSHSFASGAELKTASSADIHLIYDTSNGSLYYDADGSGLKAAIQFATLVGLPELTAWDLHVV